MSKQVKWLAGFLIVATFIIVGYLRDFIMVNINYLLDFVKNPDKEFYAHSFFNFLKTTSFQKLYYSKYVLTLLFILINLALGLALIRVIFNKKALSNVLMIVYAATFAFAAIVFVTGILIGSADQGYLFSREIMGFLQSPVPCAILILAYPLYKQNSQ